MGVGPGAGSPSAARPGPTSNADPVTNIPSRCTPVGLLLAASLALGGALPAYARAPTAATAAGRGSSAHIASAAHVPCRPARGTTTIAHSRRARIFSDERTGDDYACLYRNGHARFLSTTEHWEYHRVHFSGRYVAFVAFAEGANANVGVMNLKTGRVRRFREYEEVAPIKPPPGECPSAVPNCSVVCPQVDSLVLKPDGAVAWIAVNFPAASPSTGASCGGQIAPVIEVRRHDRRGLKVIATGAGIVPSSLRLAGSTLSFSDDGRTVTSTLL